MQWAKCDPRCSTAASTETSNSAPEPRVVPTPQLTEPRFDLEVLQSLLPFTLLCRQISKISICYAISYTHMHACCSCRIGPRGKSLRASTSSSILSAASRSFDAAVVAQYRSSTISYMYNLSRIAVVASQSCIPILYFYPRTCYCCCYSRYGWIVRTI